MVSEHLNSCGHCVHTLFKIPQNFGGGLKGGIWLKIQPLVLNFVCVSKKLHCLYAYITDNFINIEFVMFFFNYLDCNIEDKKFHNVFITDIFFVKDNEYIIKSQIGRKYTILFKDFYNHKKLLNITKSVTFFLYTSSNIVL